MKMKRAFCLLLALAMMLTLLAGCGSTAQAAETTEEKTAEPAVEPAAAEADAPDAAEADSSRLTLEEADELAALMPDATKNIVFLSGTWQEMGYQYASNSPKEIKLEIERALGSKLASYGSVEEAFSAKADTYAEYESTIPELLDLFTGIAEALGYTQEEVFLGLCNVGGGCNSSAAWGDATEGDIYAAVNSDSPDAGTSYYEPMTVFYPNDPDYPEDTIPVMTWRGLLSNGIINDSGVMYTLTQSQDAVEGDSSDTPVIPHYFALIEASRRATADEALGGLTNYLDNHSSTQPSNVMMMDESGIGYVVEMTNTEYAVRRQNQSYEGDRSYFIFNNQFQDPEMDDHNTHDGTWDDCPVRYETVKYFFERDYGSINAETMREAMACQTFVDPDTGKMNSEVIYGNSPSSYYSPENVAANEKSAGRMIADLTTREVYVLNGDEDANMTIFPNANGVYSRIVFSGSASDITADAKNYAQLYMFQAIRDLADGDAADERQEALDSCKEEYFRGVNYMKMAGGFSDSSEQLTMYSKAASAFLKSQAWAKLAWNDSNKIYSDFDGAGYIF